MNTVQPEIVNLLIESLGFIPHINSAGHFSSHHKTKFRILVAWRIAADHIILVRPKSRSKHLAISSSVLLNLSADPFCCGVSGMIFFCRMPASKQHVLNCSERNSFALFCLSFFGVLILRTNFFRLASASLFALSKSINTNFVYWSANTMRNRNPDSDSTLKGPITSVNTLSSFSSAWVSATLVTGVFVIFANEHKLHGSSSSHTVSGAFLATSAWFKWTNRMCHSLALSNFTLLKLILNSWTLQGK